jgi:hypothetical protein
MVRDRRHRGVGGLADVFPRCVAAWRAAHPDDPELDGLFARFLSSSSIAAWREQPGDDSGAAIEDCFADFARAEGLATPTIVEDERLSALLRALTVSPEPSFRPPDAVRRAPGGWFALCAADAPVLYAALNNRYTRGPVTPVIATLLGGAAPDGTQLVRARLVEMGLLAQDDPDGAY